MKLLLDTDIWIWSLLQPERIAPRVQTALQDPANEKWLSPISVWKLVEHYGDLSQFERCGRGFIR